MNEPRPSATLADHAELARITLKAIAAIQEGLHEMRNQMNTLSLRLELLERDVPR